MYVKLGYGKYFNLCIIVIVLSMIDRLGVVANF